MNKERLKTGLEMMGVAADETALDRFEAFHAILDEYNARMDLTAVLDEDERVDRHDLDSAAPLAHGLLAQGAKVIDVGTGAGFPGMPLLILRPDLQITFLDALNKRILFLEDALKRLGLTAATLHARAEDAAKMAAHREQYDAAVSRAVANAATLEELEYADLLLHVIDSSNLQWRQQADTVDRLIRELGADTIPCIRVYNKSDLSFPGERAKEADAVAISAKTGEGIPDLLALIDKKLDKGTKRVTLHLPYDKAGALDSLYREAKVESVEYGATVDVVAVCNPRLLGQLKDYIEGWQPPKEEWE